MYNLDNPPSSEMEAQARKMSVPYLYAVSSRCSRLIVEAMEAGDQEGVLRRQQERQLVCQIAGAKEKLAEALT